MAVQRVCVKSSIYTAQGLARAFITLQNRLTLFSQENVLPPIHYEGNGPVYLFCTKTYFSFD